MMLKHAKRDQSLIGGVICSHPNDSIFAGQAVGKQALSYSAGGTTNTYNFSGGKFSDT